MVRRASPVRTAARGTALLPPNPSPFLQGPPSPLASSPEPRREAGRVTNAALAPAQRPSPAAVGDSGATAPAWSRRWRRPRPPLLAPALTAAARPRQRLRRPPGSRAWQQLRPPARRFTASGRAAALARPAGSAAVVFLLRRALAAPLPAGGPGRLRRSSR